MSEIKLKPCPFCGNKAWTFHIPENDHENKNILHELIRKAPGRWLVGCDTQLCMLNINNMPETFASEQEAAEAWNMRAERRGYWKQATPFVDTIECSECGYQWPEPAMASKYCPDCGALMLMDEEASV